MIKISLTTSAGVPEALSNLCYRPTTVEDIKDTIEDSTTAREIVYNLSKLNILRRFIPDRETDTYIRLKGIDSLGNISYLRINKDPKSDTTLERFLSNWIKDNYQNIRKSEYFTYVEDDITPELFIEDYIIPTIKTNIEYDFNTTMDVAQLFKLK